MRARTRMSIATTVTGCAALMATAAPADAGPSAAKAAPAEVVQTFTQPGKHTFAAPQGAKKVMFAIIGGGGGGGGGGDSVGSSSGTGKGAGGGGGGSGALTVCTIPANLAGSTELVVGAGGKGTYNDGVDGKNSTVTIYGSLDGGPRFPLEVGHAVSGGRATEALKGVRVGYGGAGGAETECRFKGMESPKKQPGQRGGNGSGPGAPGYSAGGVGGAPGDRLAECPQAGTGGSGGTGGYGGLNTSSRGKDGVNGQPGCIVVVTDPTDTTLDNIFAKPGGTLDPVTGEPVDPEDQD